MPDTNVVRKQPEDGSICGKDGRNGMEDGKKKIWICILVVVLAAVVIGILYYLSAPQGQSEEGFLIRENARERCVPVRVEEPEGAMSADNEENRYGAQAILTGASAESEAKYGIGE